MSVFFLLHTIPRNLPRKPSAVVLLPLQCHFTGISLDLTGDVCSIRSRSEGNFAFPCIMIFTFSISIPRKCENWREKTCFFVFFMKNNYENTVSIPIGIKNTIFPKPENSIENGHQNTVNWWLDRFETLKMKASDDFVHFAKPVFSMNGANMLKKNTKNKKTRFFCHFSLLLTKTYLQIRFQNATFCWYWWFSVTDRHFPLENRKSLCILGEELDRKWRKVNPLKRCKIRGGRLPIAQCWSPNSLSL